MGHFDIIGDVHGCRFELDELLERLQPERTLVFLGDLVDGGPDAPGVLRRVMALHAEGRALVIRGNHDDRLLRYLRGETVKKSARSRVTHAQLEAEPPAFKDEVAAWLDSLPAYLYLDEGRLLVAHAGMKRELIGVDSPETVEFALHGEYTGEVDEFGRRVRTDWTAEYDAVPLVVYGHTPYHEPRRVNNTIGIDTGCSFGGTLTALRYPELTTVHVQAREAYAVSDRFTPLEMQSAS